MGVWLSMSVKNLPIYAKGKGEETGRRLLRLVITSVLWGVRKPSPAVMKGSVLHAAVLTAPMLEREKKNPSAQRRLTGVYIWAEVCHRCAFSARPVEFFHHSFMMKSDSFLWEGNSEWITQINVTAMVDWQAVNRRSCAAGPRLMFRSEAKKKCKELKSQAQIKSRLFGAVQHLEKYTIMRIRLLLWLLFQWSKPLYIWWLLQFNWSIYYILYHVA